MVCHTSHARKPVLPHTCGSQTRCARMSDLPYMQYRYVLMHPISDLLHLPDTSAALAAWNPQGSPPCC
eukprot:2125340-Rhodomonas_salina.1